MVTLVYGIILGLATAKGIKTHIDNISRTLASRVDDDDEEEEEDPDLLISSVESIPSMQSMQKEEDIKKICEQIDSIDAFIDQKFGSVEDRMNSLEKNMTTLARVVKGRIAKVRTSNN